MAGGGSLAECVINISEGRDRAIIEAVPDAGGPVVLDVHSDPEHHRSVLTLGGTLEAVEASARDVVGAAVARIDLRSHAGVHPRLGAADVVPFVPLSGIADTLERDGRSARQASVRLRPDVLEARNRFATWAGTELQLPCFLYGPERSLPDVRRDAYTSLEPDTGPRRPHPTAGSAAVGARPCSWPTTCGSATTDTPVGMAGGITPCRWPAPWPPATRPGCTEPGPGRRRGRPGQLQPDRPGIRFGGRCLRCGRGRRGIVGMLGPQSRARRSHPGPRPGPGAPTPMAGTRPRRIPDHRGPHGGRRVANGSRPAAGPPAVRRPFRKHSRWLGAAWPAGAATAGVHARTVPPRSRTSPHWPGRIPSSLRVRHIPGRPLGLAGGCSPFGEEQIRIDSHAVGPGLPAALLGPVHQ